MAAAVQFTQNIRNPNACIIGHKVDTRKMTLMTVEEKELLTRAANLMDELLETIEVTQDKKLVKELKAALKEVEENKTKPIEELIRDLNLDEDLRN